MGCTTIIPKTPPKFQVCPHRLGGESGEVKVGTNASEQFFKENYLIQRYEEKIIPHFKSLATQIYFFKTIIDGGRGRGPDAFSVGPFHPVEVTVDMAGLFRLRLDMWHF